MIVLSLTLAALWPVSLSADIVSSGSTTLVAQEILYHSPMAGEVLLIWGINGWQQVPEDQRPAGTIVSNKVMQTPMVQKGNAFIIKVWVPLGSTLNYGFWTNKMRDGSWAGIWDGGGTEGYRASVRQTDVLEASVSRSTFDQLTQIDLKPLLLGVKLMVVAAFLFVAILFTPRLLSQRAHDFGMLETIRTFIRRHRVACLLSCSFVLYIIAINPELYLWEDDARYIIAGKALATGQGLHQIHDIDNPPYPYPNPMLPALLAPIIALFGYQLWPMNFAMVGLTVLALYLSHLMFKDLLDETDATLLLLFVAVSPQIVSFSHQVMTEIPYVVFSLLALMWMRTYATDARTLTVLGLLTAAAMTGTLLTKSIGLAVVLAAVTSLLHAPLSWLQACKKACFLVLASGFTWLLSNYSILRVMPYNNEFASSLGGPSQTVSELMRSFVLRITTNFPEYFQRLPEIILYTAFDSPSAIWAALAGFIVGFGFLYAFLKHRSIMEYYVLFYMSILLVYDLFNLGNTQRYLVPIIPMIAYYFIGGLNQVIARLAGSEAPFRNASGSADSNPASGRMFDLARGLSLALVSTMIIFNFVSTVRASVLKMEPEMFDYYGQNNGFQAYKAMASWAKQHTDPRSVIMTRRPDIFHIWSLRTITRYPLVSSQASRDEIVRALFATRADYIALDTLDFEITGHDRLLMNVVQETPNAFQIVYQDGNNRLFRVLRDAVKQAETGSNGH